MIRRAVVCATMLSACSFDVSKLRGRDGGADAARDAPVVDVPVVDVPVVDVPVADVPVDRATRPPSTGACPAGRYTELQGADTASALVTLEDSNADAGTSVPDGAALAGCEADPTPSPTRLFRYVVRQGTRLAVSTNTGHCGGVDTRVYAFRSCDAVDGGANSLGCSDDIMSPQLLCGACAGSTSPMMNCSTLKSSLDVDVVPGDVVFLAVNGYQGMSGPYRLWVGENPVTLEPLFATPPTGITPVNRCTCQSTLTRLGAVTFPGGPDGTMDAGFGPLTAGSSVLGARMIPAGRVAGMTAQLRFTDARVTTDAACVGTTIKATFDLYVGNSLVTSFSVRTPLLTPTTVTLPLTTFAPVTIPATNTRMQLNLRAVEPPNCLTLELDRSGANVVTLYSP